MGQVSIRRENDKKQKEKKYQSQTAEEEALKEMEDGGGLWREVTSPAQLLSLENIKKTLRIGTSAQSYAHTETDQLRCMLSFFMC